MPDYAPPPEQALRWVEQCFDRGASVVSTERLHGGVMADMDRILIRDRSGSHRQVVLRRWSTSPFGDIDDYVLRETRALQSVAAQGIAAPLLIASEPTGEHAGVRCVLMSHLPGEVVLTPTDPDRWLESLARRLARIHELRTALSAPTIGRFNPDADFGWISDPGLRRDALGTAGANIDDQPAVFLHGDYQHFNILWSEDEISGVVDWTMAGTGPRGIDVGHCRLNLAVLFTADVAEDYLRRYERSAGVRVDGPSDLRSLLAWSPHWIDFIPRQVNGRADLDLSGMQNRVVDTIRRSLSRSA